MVNMPPLSRSQPPLASFEPVARLSGVSKRFGSVAALTDVSLEVARGRVLGVIGRSGAGKSTLIRLLNGLERPDAGSVQFEGQELTGLSERALQPVRQRIGMIFQHFNLLSAKTVAANVALPLRIVGRPKPERARRVAELLELVGLADKAGAYPAQLSGGQKQRVGIARALAAEPALLLSDEATSALDPETTESILALLRSINRELGLSIVLITHEMGVVRAVADEVAIMEGGRLIEQGPVGEVFTQPRSEGGRRLVAAVRPGLPGFLRARLSARAAASHDPVLQIDILGEQARGPVLARLAAALGAEPTLLHGGIDHVGEQPFGRIYISLRGADDGAAADLAGRALAFLDGVGDAEVIGYVRRAV
ncbi:MAG: methionine ABC transporter ATP-binding protein [Janthinobacterium lividum]